MNDIKNNKVSNDVPKKSDKIEVEGIVIDSSNNEFKVELPNKHVVVAHVSGKMRMNNIRILLGDKVTMEISPYDLTRGIIKWNNR